MNINLNTGQISDLNDWFKKYEEMIYEGAQGSAYHKFKGLLKELKHVIFRVDGDDFADWLKEEAKHYPYNYSQDGETIRIDQIEDALADFKKAKGGE